MITLTPRTQATLTTNSGISIIFILKPLAPPLFFSGVFEVLS